WSQVRVGVRVDHAAGPVLTLEADFDPSRVDQALRAPAADHALTILACGRDDPGRSLELGGPGDVPLQSVRARAMVCLRVQDRGGHGGIDALLFRLAHPAQHFRSPPVETHGVCLSRISSRIFPFPLAAALGATALTAIGPSKIGFPRRSRIVSRSRSSGLTVLDRFAGTIARKSSITASVPSVRISRRVSDQT